MKRYAIQQGSMIGDTAVKGYGRKDRTQRVLTIFNSKKDALVWKNTWKNKEQLKIIRVEINIL